jgi:hypothetical protein
MALPEQMVRAARLERTLYAEVEADPGQTANALGVVVLASLANGIATAASSADTSAPVQPATAIVLAIVVGVLAWAVWTAFIYFVGTRFLGGAATWGELIRTVGFANSPGVLAIAGSIPGVGQAVAFVAAIWVVAATVVAVQHTLEISLLRAISATAAGGIIAAFLTAGLFAAVAIPMGLTGNP